MGDSESGPRDGGAAPLWWPVTNVKFVVMTIGTMGIYHYYWIYGNWRLLRAREGTAWNPVWRTLFAPFTMFRMYERVRESAAAHDVRAPWGAMSLAVIYFVANLALFIGISPWLMGPVLLLPVLPVQMTMARVNAAAAPRAERNGRLTVANLAMLAGGAALTAWLYVNEHLVDALLKEWNP